MKGLLRPVLIFIWFIFVIEIILSIPKLNDTEVENVMNLNSMNHQYETTHQNTIEYSVIIPTYQEAENIEILLEELKMAFEEQNLAEQTEIVIVDDNSQDGIQEIITKFNNRFPSVKVKLIIRESERGLSSAVIRGFSESKGKYLLCMDADLQHPPSSAPTILLTLKNKKCEFTIGTRYPSQETLKQFEMEENANLVSSHWSFIRKTISWGARTLAQPLIFSGAHLSDPMSGFFGISKDAFERANKKGINMIGFKVSLELFVKGKIQQHCEVPYHFGVRKIGNSKLSSKVIFYYVLHLISLYNFRFPYIWAIIVQSFIVFCFLCLLLMFQIKFVLWKYRPRRTNRKRLNGKLYIS